MRVEAAEGEQEVGVVAPRQPQRHVARELERLNVAAFEQPLPIETVDILPTLAALIRLQIPAAEIDGRCIDLDAGPEDTCAVESR